MSSLTIARHDVAHDPIPIDTYDLVHARLVLVHVPERERVLADLARSLRPGGWLIVEDFDAVLQDVWDPQTADDAVFRRVHRAVQELLVRRGGDIRYARRLPQLMRAAGLEHISIEARFVLGAAARPGIDAMRANFVQTRAELIAAELVTAEDVDRAVGLLDTAEFPVLPLMVSARGRKDH
jgi:SAM-dependent methyltransferase